MKEKIIEILINFYLTNKIKTYDECAEEILRVVSFRDETEECDIHATDLFGKCFKCGKQVFVRKDEESNSD